MKTFILIASLSLSAQAGFIKDFCERHLRIPQDPYQFEGVSEPWLVREREKLSIKKNWNRATADDVELFDIINKELKRRKGVFE